MSEKAIELIKAGARHNRFDRRTLEEMMGALYQLGAVCPICGNAPHKDDEGGEGDEGKAAHSMASTHVVIPSDHPAAVTHKRVRGSIAEGDLNAKGIEDYPHVTIKYGLRDGDLDEVRAIIESEEPFTIRLGAGQIFTRPDYDVLYVDVESEELRELQEKLVTIGDSPEWDTYTPHLTIAYLLPQRGGKYLPLDDFIGDVVLVTAVEFSTEGDEKITIELRGDDTMFDGMSFEAIRDKVYREWDKHTKDKYADEFTAREFYTYVVATWDDKVVIYWNGEYFNVPFATMGEDLIFAKRDKWTPVDKIEAWVAKHAEFLAQNAKSTPESEPVPAADAGDDDIMVKSILSDDGNFLKSVEDTDDTWVVANHIILWGDENTRDAEGLLTKRKNADGTIGEWFGKTVDWQSAYTGTGVLHVDIEHGREVTGRDDVIGVVDMKSARMTDKGLFVKRILDKKNWYTRWLYELHQKGVRFATSSEPVQDDVVKSPTGEIIRWPLRRDTVTVGPMEPRMILESNWLEDVKSSVGGDIPAPLYDALLKSGLLQSSDTERNDLVTAGAERADVAKLRMKAAAARAQLAIAEAVE